MAISRHVLRSPSPASSSRRRSAIAAALLLGAAAGCAPELPLRVPMPSVADRSHRRAHTLIVFLPGRSDRSRTFVEQGFLEAVRARHVDADLIAADAVYAYYLENTFAERFHQDILRPALERGYRRVVLVGVSIGAYGALDYARRHRGTIDTVVLLSPFLGEGPILDDIREAGGLAAWRPDLVTDILPFGDLWHWLKDYPATPALRDARGYPRIVLAHGGAFDLFQRQTGWLESALPPSDVVATLGSHTWPTWRILFARVLEAGFLDSPGGGPNAPARTAARSR